MANFETLLKNWVVEGVASEVDDTKCEEVDSYSLKSWEVLKFRPKKSIGAF